MESSTLVLIDTSVVIAFLRNTTTPEVARLHALITEDRAAWCDIVKLELWAGVRGQKEMQAIEDLDEAMTTLPTTSNVWAKAHELGRKCRSVGLAFPAPDLLICATALEYKTAVLTADAHIKTVLQKFNGSK